MRKLPLTTAALPRRASRPSAFSLSGWLTGLLRVIERRGQSRRGLHRLLADPHLARDVGLSADQIRGELIRLRREVR